MLDNHIIIIVSSVNSPQLLRHSVSLHSALLITCIPRAYIYNPEGHRETEGLFLQGGVWIISTASHNHMWGPQGLLIWRMCCWLGALHQENRASRSQIWQLETADFIPAVEALPTQVEWTDLLSFFPSCAQKAWIHISLNQIPQSVPTSLNPVWDAWWWSLLHGKQSWTDENQASVPEVCSLSFAQRLELIRSESSCFRSCYIVFLEMEKLSELCLSINICCFKRWHSSGYRDQVPHVSGKRTFTFTLHTG